MLARLGDPQLHYPSIHVVGTNGKSTVTRTTEALLAGAGLAVGAYLSPHVRGWGERIRVRGEEADFDAAIDRLRAEAELLEATQFEVLTAAALAEFAEAGVDVAVVEAGLGGRHDATNVLRSPVQVLTNVALEHTEVLGTTREAIAAEKLAVVQPGAVVVLGEPEWEALARDNGAGQVVVAGNSNLALAIAAAEAFLGRPVDGHVDVQLPGRLERLSEDPLEIWDGAHNLAGLGYALPRLPAPGTSSSPRSSRTRRSTGCSRLSPLLGDRLVATSSTNERALPAAELARRAEPFFTHVEPIETRLRRSRTPAPSASRSWSRGPFTSWPIWPRMRACDGERWRQADRPCLRRLRPGGDRGTRVSCRVRNRKNPSVTASAFTSIHDFFASGTWQVIRNLLFFFLIAFWLAVGYWVYKDAKRRIEDPVLIATAVAIGLIIPYIGALVYMLFRPPEYLEDVRERELEIKAMEERLARRDLYCPVCRAEVSNEFLVCPVCTTKLKQACTNCKAPLEALWQVCPYCETAVEPTAVDFPTFEVRPPRRRRRSE